MIKNGDLTNKKCDDSTSKIGDVTTKKFWCSPWDMWIYEENKEFSNKKLGFHHRKLGLLPTNMQSWPIKTSIITNETWDFTIKSGDCANTIVMFTHKNEEIHLQRKIWF